MIEMAVAVAMHCAPQKQPKPKPIQYTRQQRLKDSFDALSKQNKLVNQIHTVYQMLNFGRDLP